MKDPTYKSNKKEIKHRNKLKKPKIYIKTSLKHP